MIATLDSKPSSRPPGKRPSWRWPLIIIGLLTGHMALMGLATAITLREPGESAVIPNYYDKAEAWDAYKKLLTESATLGWNTGIFPAPATRAGRRQLRLTLTDAHDKPISDATLSVRCFHLSHGDEAVTLKPASVAPGSFLLTLPSSRTGFWQFELTACAGTHTFVKTVTQYVD